MRVRNPDEGRAAVQLLKRRGVDLIKVHNYTPRDVFFAIADEARQQKLPVTGHVPLKVTIQEGVDAGMVSIEHLSEDAAFGKRFRRRLPSDTEIPGRVINSRTYPRKTP